MMTHVERQSDGAAVGIVTLQEDLLVQFELWFVHVIIERQEDQLRNFFRFQTDWRIRIRTQAIR